MLISALLATALSAPVPKVKPVYYFPTTVGTKRVLETTVDGKTTKRTEEVMKVEEKDGTCLVTVGWTAYGSPTKEVYEVTAMKIHRMGVLDPRTLFDLSVKAGESWSVERGIRASKTVILYTPGKEEEIEVPAGKFKAIPVIEQLKGNEVKTTRWYAPAVGLVKEAEAHPSYTASTVLKSFTVEKDEKK